MKAPRRWPNSSASSSSRGQRGAVDRHERTGRARAGGVDLAGDHLLAAAGLALEQHGCVRAGRASCQLEQLERARVDGDQLARPRRGALGQDPALDGLEQVVGSERLHQVVDGSAAHALDGALHGGEGGDDHDRHLGETLAHGGRDVAAAHPRHAQVGDHQAGRLAHRLQRTRAAGEGLHLVATATQYLGHRLGHRRLVVDHHHSSAHPLLPPVDRPAGRRHRAPPGAAVQLNASVAGDERASRPRGHRTCGCRG